jgi:hypothetical protein
MFRRQNLKWAVPLAVVLFVCVAAGVRLLVDGKAEAQTAPPPMAAAALVDAMQARAGGLSGLRGMLGVQVTAPRQEGWKGVPFLYRGPDGYARQDGRAVSARGEEPAEGEDAWTIFKGGYVYSRERARRLRGWADDLGEAVSWNERSPTVMARPGDRVRGRSYGTDVDALLMVNLMPKAWFEPCMKDLSVGAVEEVDGRSYYTILDAPEPLEGSDQLVRWPELWQDRTPRKYYVNAASFVCERLVWGAVGAPDAFAASGRDIIAGDVQDVGGSPLPLTYTLRFHGPSGVHFALQARLEELTVTSADAVAESSFDADALSPVLLRRATELEDLEGYAAGHPDDADAWLSLADASNRTQQFFQARDALERATELAGAAPPLEFQAESARIWHELKYLLIPAELREAVQMERIYAERAARFGERGDGRRADEMAAQEARWRGLKESAVSRAQSFGVSVAGIAD